MDGDKPGLQMIKLGFDGFFLIYLLQVFLLWAIMKITKF